MENNPTILLSFPRSGNHLIRFIIEFLTLKPTSGCKSNNKDKPIYTNNFKDKTVLANVNKTADFICYKCHFVKHIKEDFINTTHNLILIIRDPKECINRHRSLDPKNKIKKQKNLHSKLYLENIEYYHNFKNKKLLIYYEDIIQHPKKIINQLFKFFNSKRYQYKKLINNINYYFDQSATATGRAWAGIISGNDINYHSAKMTEEEKINFIDEINETIKDYIVTIKYINKYIK